MNDKMKAIIGAAVIALSIFVLAQFSGKYEIKGTVTAVTANSITVQTSPVNYRTVLCDTKKFEVNPGNAYSVLLYDNKTADDSDDYVVKIKER